MLIMWFWGYLSGLLSQWKKTVLLICLRSLSVPVMIVSWFGSNWLGQNDRPSWWTDTMSSDSWKFDRFNTVTILRGFSFWFMGSAVCLHGRPNSGMLWVVTNANTDVIAPTFASSLVCCQCCLVVGNHSAGTSSHRSRALLLGFPPPPLWGAIMHALKSVHMVSNPINKVFVGIKF